MWCIDCQQKEAYQKAKQSQPRRVPSRTELKEHRQKFDEMMKAHQEQQQKNHVENIRALRKARQSMADHTPSSSPSPSPSPKKKLKVISKHHKKNSRYGDEDKDDSDSPSSFHFATPKKSSQTKINHSPSANIKLDSGNAEEGELAHLSFLVAVPHHERNIPEHHARHHESIAPHEKRDHSDLTSSLLIEGSPVHLLSPTDKHHLQQSRDHQTTSASNDEECDNKLAIDHPERGATPPLLNSETLLSSHSNKNLISLQSPQELVESTSNGDCLVDFMVDEQPPKGSIASRRDLDLSAAKDRAQQIARQILTSYSHSTHDEVNYVAVTPLLDVQEQVATRISPDWLGALLT
jgi:hypothetical protein